MTPVDPSRQEETPDAPSVLTLPGLLLASIVGLLVWVLFREVGIIIPIATASLLLWRPRGMHWRSGIILLLVVLGSLWILYKARAIVYPLIFALLVAYWLDPLVHRLSRRGIRREVGALVAILPVVAAGAIFAIFVVPILVDQTAKLIAGIPGVMEFLATKAESWIAYVLPAGWRPDLQNWLKPLQGHFLDILKGFGTSLWTVTKGIGAVIGFLGMLVLAPVLTYYILADFDRLRGWIEERMPAQRREGIAPYVSLAEGAFRHYFRGQVFVALLVGLYFSIALTIIGLPSSILLGFLAGILNLVPVLGFAISLALFVIAALLSPHPGALLLRLVVVLVIEQVLESQILTPRIVGRAVGLNPALTLLSVLVFGAVLGPFGVLIAVPAAAMIRGFLQLHDTRNRPSGR